MSYKEGKGLLVKDLIEAGKDLLSHHNFQHMWEKTLLVDIHHQYKLQLTIQITLERGGVVDRVLIYFSLLHGTC